MHVSVQPDNPFVNNANFFHGFPVHEIAVALPSTVVLATWLTGCYKKFELCQATCVARFPYGYGLTLD